jgi:hypothetical protein
MWGLGLWGRDVWLGYMLRILIYGIDVDVC